MRASISSVCLCVLIAMLCGDAQGAAPVGGHPDHAAARAQHHVDLRAHRVTASGRQAWMDADAALDRMVYGYLPYWEMGYEVPHWNLLEVLAWFAVGIDASGEVKDWNGWGGAATEALVEEAHANQTLVTVTITLFDNAEIDALLSSESSRAQAIQTCLDVMAIHGADGVNIDFEFVPSSSHASFVTFMAALKLAVAEVQPNGGEGHVTLAGPAVDWTGGYDYDQLLAVTDGIMVMGYGYHYGGGDPGPNAPLFGGGIWGPYSVAWTIADYIDQGAEPYLERIFFGLPWYGRSWPVATTEVPGTALSGGKAIWFDVAVSEAALYGATYDTDSHTPYYHKEVDGTLWQVWYDDVASFREKLAYIDAQGLGGIGLWALGYEGGEGGYWQAIADQFTTTMEQQAPEEQQADAGSSGVANDATVAEGGDALDSGDAGSEDREVGPEVDASFTEVHAARVVVNTVSQATIIRETTPDGCQTGRGSPLRNCLALFVMLSAIVALRQRRAS
ncbi:MAG: glycosyl hydrolase family 18 protein [Myxococcota bacterium]